MASVLVVTSTITIAEALDVLNWTATELAAKAGVHTGTVMRAMIKGGKYKTNDTCAVAIARALGLEVEEIEWANGLSPLGRPAETGVPIGYYSQIPYGLCPEHHLALPATKVCDMCS